ncbi:MAG: DEAD/DEAH box helicase family protein [Saprospiraceae bacterium]|nr:DEAD/DEAH box helicase family protein [Saprospiraceae bacterium]MCC6841881.1 DEAD/DEAH box helicase family protein [Saprospiraceae bacterium]
MPKENLFDRTDYNIIDNESLREPQRDGFIEIKKYFDSNPNEREIGIVLPVGCGKSGLITLTPYATNSVRTLVVAPGLNIKSQLFDDFDPTNPSMFYQKCYVITSDFPEPATIEGTNTNIGDLENADVVITNIQQIQGEDNFWLTAVPDDFFDLILVDEAHHNVADSWARIRGKFSNAKIVNYSATPTRADGRLMAGRIIYSFPIYRAMELGYVKRLKAKVLNPSSLTYIRNEDGNEIEVTLDQIRELGETDSPFRRSIVSSQESLTTIVDCSIRELYALRERTGDNKHKIIVSALNYRHCIQITQAYSERGLRADYVHSNEDSVTNERILQKLENHELDVVIQVRKLGEGFDHPYLSVAAVCSVFSNLSPFAQFVGRIMRVVDQNQPNSLNNQGIVVFHAGSNIANRWADFQEFSEADQEFFNELLPMEELDFDEAEELEIIPRGRNTARVQIMEQEEITIEEVPLVDLDETTRIDLDNLRQRLQEQGIDLVLRSIPVTRQRRRQASRSQLDNLIRNSAGEILNRLNLNPQGSDLDTNRLGRTNFVVAKSDLDREANNLIGRSTGERSEFTQEEINLIFDQFDDIIIRVQNKYTDA